MMGWLITHWKQNQTLFQLHSFHLTDRNQISRTNNLYCWNFFFLSKCLVYFILFLTTIVIVVSVRHCVHFSFLFVSISHPGIYRLAVLGWRKSLWYRSLSAKYNENPLKTRLLMQQLDVIINYMGRYKS